MTCTPSNLALSAKCFCGIPRRDSRAILIYALCLVAQVGLSKGFRYEPASAIISWIDVFNPFGTSGDLATFLATANIPTVTGVTWPNHDVTAIHRLNALPALTSINISGNGGINSLNASGCLNLTTITANNSSLISVNCSGDTALVTLLIQNSFVSSLNINGCVNLVTINAGYTSIPSIDVSGFTSLISLYTNDNVEILTILAAGCTSLTFMAASNDTALTHADMTNCTALQSAFFDGILSVCTVDLINCNALTNLDTFGSPSITINGP